jgi:hypothetical protein
MNKVARLELFYERLAVAPAAKSRDESYALICEILDAIEDEFSGVPNNPSNWQTGGRLYPPQTDRAYAVDGFPEVIRYKSFRHETYIATNGAIEVKLITTNVVDFTKPGANGKGVWE